MSSSTALVQSNRQPDRATLAAALRLALLAGREFHRWLAIQPPGALHDLGRRADLRESAAFHDAMRDLGCADLALRSFEFSQGPNEVAAGVVPVIDIEAEGGAEVLPGVAEFVERLAACAAQFGFQVREHPTRGGVVGSLFHIGFCGLNLPENPDIQVLDSRYGRFPLLKIAQSVTSQRAEPSLHVRRVVDLVADEVSRVDIPGAVEDVVANGTGCDEQIAAIDRRCGRFPLLKMAGAVRPRPDGVGLLPSRRQLVLQRNRGLRLVLRVWVGRLQPSPLLRVRRAVRAVQRKLLDWGGL